MFHLTYDALGVKVSGTLQVCDGCAISKEKLRAAKKKMFTRAKKARENIFVDTNSSLPESLSGNRYWIGVVDD